MSLSFQTLLRVGAVVVIGAANAASASGTLQPAFRENTHCKEEVFQSALQEIRHKNYEQGRLLLEELLERKCSLMPAAMLLIADSYYREGGWIDLIKAEVEYARWLRLFPELDIAPLVMKKIAEAHLRRINGRDGGNHTLLANRALLNLQDSFPQFDIDPSVQDYVMVTQELRAEHNLKVVRFYLEVRESAIGAKMRCLEILEKSPRFTKMDIALWYLGRAEELLAATAEAEDNINSAIASYSRIAREYADSEYREGAIERLRVLGGDVPESDPEINARIREQASKVESILTAINTGVTLRGVLLDEEDELDLDGLKTMLKQ